MDQGTLSKTTARSYVRSSSFQMALLFTVLCGMALAILGYFTFYFNKDTFIESTEAVIESELKYAALLNNSETITSFLKNEGRVFLLMDNKEAKIAGNLEKLPDNINRLSEGTILFDVDKKQIAAKIYTFDDERKLLLGIDVSKVSKDYKRMQTLSILSIIIMLVVIITSYLISTFVVTHTNKIAITAKEIMDTGDLSKRIEVGSRWDDLSYMAQVLNQFLERIEQLMIGIKQVSDNIAHDLRTPLTRIRNSLEQCRDSKDVKNIASLNHSLENLIYESDQLLNTFNSILKISRVEAAKQKSDFEQCDIKEIISDAVEMYSPLIENKDIALELRLQSYKMLCDKNLLFQAIANIVDNALKFTPQDGAISITSRLLEDQFIIRFDDTGPGIHEKEMTKVFDRFYRADSSRNTEGSGLGLSLVRAVIELHNGNISLENLDPGLRIELLFNN